MKWASKKAKLVAPAAHGGLCWLPDGSGVLFTRHAVERFSGSMQHDVYLYRVQSKKTVRISKGFRAEAVDVSPDGKAIVFTINEEGRREFAFASLPNLDDNFKFITRADITYRHPSLPH